MSARSTSEPIMIFDHYRFDRVASPGAGGLRGHGSHAIQGIRTRVSHQIEGMSAVLQEADCRKCLRTVEEYCLDCLNRIETQIQRGDLLPWVSLRLGEQDPQPAAHDRLLRVGVYPIAANPIHWAHLAVGLSAVAGLGLDKMIYIIAGSDPRKPALASRADRHAVGKRIIEMFHPLFAYSPLAWGNALAGETNLFRFLDLNRHQAMEVFYVAGTDHFRRSSPLTGQPDTIGRLEEGLRSMNAGGGGCTHRVAAAFLERQPLEERIESFVPIHLLPPLPFGFSSTSIRASLTDPSDRRGLAGLPFEAFVRISTHRARRLRSTPGAAPLPILPLARSNAR